MSTGLHRLPQAIGHHFLPDGVDSFGRHVEGNVVIVAPVEITDPAHLPCGGPAEPGLWGEAVRVEDPGGRPLRFLDLPNDDYPLDLDPAEPVTEPAGPGDYHHLDTQYEGPAAA